MKLKMFSIRIEEKLIEEYRMFCEENSINISARLRKFMERDMEQWRLRKIAIQRNNAINNNNNNKSS